MKKFSRFAVAGLLTVAAMSAQASTFIGDRTDFRDETIYFAMTTRFYDGDPMNNVCSWDKQDQQISTKDPAWRGDFKGLIEKLDYIKALGFTAIWITPVVQNGSGIDYHGYHAMDMSKVDLRYESRKEWGCEDDVKFQDLIDAAHAKGMKIVLDVVLQHTGNFGEAHLNPLFTRNQNIRNQANIEVSMKPDAKLGGSSYWKLKPDGSAPGTQYGERWKYFKNPQYETNNYYHHYGTGWNWDLPNRWWGQIAGDCVDLNTENDAVAQYVVDCYGKFIEMGVDAFRIDTSGHISPLTFNKQFIPQFHEIANRPEVRAKRLNGIDFYMFGEVCQRYQGTVVYRGQPNLSSYFYTWKSDQALLDEFNGDPAWWSRQSLPEGHDTPVGPMIVCESDTKDKPRSNNVFLQNGAWHEPDYSQVSGFNVIDFPIHYSFKSVSEVFGLFSEDNYYNDASFNVVYVDSHDYGPGPNDGIRFNGGTDQWAENLSWMFTFRGIPCIYYGSEVEFMKGCIIDDGMKTALNKTGRAYFGHYLEGTVNATDFGQYTATGQVAETLNGDLAHHIQQLNKIRAAVPALRKGQYTFDGCSANGGWAFKRAYKDESYVLVAVNGGATFTDVPAGTYTDIVTGKTYTGGGSITVDAPQTQGQLRVLVKDWTGDKVVDYGKFIYDTTPVAKGGNPTCTDPGTEHFYTKEDAIDESVGMIFSPNGGVFKTETLSVTASLTVGSTSGTFKVGDGPEQTINAGETKTFTVGQGMNFNETVTVTWTATGKEGDENGMVTFKKVDPNAVTNIYVTGTDGTVTNISGTKIYCWSGATKFAGEWPGKTLTETEEIDGKVFYTFTADSSDPVNVIFSRNDAKTADITDVQGDVFFEYDGSTTAREIQVQVGLKKPRISATPASGTKFNESLSVTLTASPATDIYYTLDGSEANASSTKYTGAINITETTTINAYAKNEVGETNASFTYTKVDGPVLEEWHAYFENTGNWPSVNAYAWDDNHMESTAFTGAWPGQNLTETVIYNGKKLYHYSYTPTEPMSNPMIIFNGAGKSRDLEWENNAIYNLDGKIGMFTQGVQDVVTTNMSIYSSNGMLVVVSANCGNVTVASIDGIVRRFPVAEGTNYYELPKGFYIVNGVKVIL